MAPLSGLRSLDLIEVLEGAYAQVAARTAFAGRVERYYETPAPHVLGDPDPLGQAFRDLVATACRAIPAPEESWGLQLGVVTVPVVEQGPASREVWVTVVALGPGQHRRRFDPFATPRARGPLAHAEEIVAAHGGSLEARPGGAAFRVRLPAGLAR